MSGDYNAGYDAGRRGSIFGPASAEGTAGFMAGMAAGRNESSGSMEWLVAPFVLWPFVAIFYPVATGAALAAAFVAESLVAAVGLGGLRWPVALVMIVLVFWPVCRMDQQWGLRSKRYYLARHVVRMIIFALFANGAAHNAGDGPATPGLQAMLQTPVYWMPVLVMLVFWQLLFMRASNFRLYWNMKLISWRLRPKDFPPFYFTWGLTPEVHRPQEPIPMPGQRSYAAPDHDGSAT